MGGAEWYVRHSGGGRHTRTDRPPPVVVTSSAAEDRVGGPMAVEESSTGGDLVGDPPAHDEGSTDRDLVGGPPAISASSTEGDRAGGPAVLAEGSVEEGSFTHLEGQTADRMMRGDSRHARRRAVHIRVSRKGRRGPHQDGSGQGREDRVTSPVEEPGKNPNAADRYAIPLEEGRVEGGVGCSAAA